MDFKTFFIKNILLSFFVSFTLISLAMMGIGFIYEPTKQFGYDIFLSPLLFSFIATLPSLLNYSRKELSIKAVIIRKVVHLLLLEVLILGVLFISQIITSPELLLSLGLSIVIIDVSVQLVLYINDKRTAVTINKSMKIYQTSFLENNGE